MANLLQDLRYALRGFLKAPVFTLVAVLSIALGIGANTAIFTLVDQVLLRLLPVKDPKQLVLLTSSGAHYGNNRGGNAISYPMYADFRDNNRVFSGMFCRFSLPLNVSFEGKTERAAGELVSGTYFQVLGVGSALGRTITPEDDRTPGGHPVAMLSHSYWKSRFASDPNVVGKDLIVNNYKLTIVGVSQEGFEGVDVGNAPQVRVPVMMKPQMTPQWNDLDNRRSRWVNVFGRLRPGVSATQAKAALQPQFRAIREMEVKEKEFANTTPYTREQFLRGWIDVLPAAQGRSPLRRQLARPLWVLMAIVALVLLIACANVANLLIARAAARQKEVAVRLALGASRGRIVRQLLVESSLLGLIGGAAGLLLAVWTVQLLLRFLPNQIGTVVISASPDLRILAFNFFIALFTGVFFGLVPALQATRPDLAPTLKDQAGGVLGGGAQVGFRKALVIAQVALSLLLLIGAGLFIRSLRNLKDLNPGFNTSNVVAFGVDPVLNGYTPERTKLFYKQLLETVNGLPGIKSASFTAVGILEGNEWDSTVSVDGYEAKPGEDMNPYCNAVSPGYFATMGMPLLAGRDFNAKDELLNRKSPDPNSPPSFRVAIANEKFVKHYWGGRNAIGRRIGFGGNPGTTTPIEIVGVVGDAKYMNLRDAVPRQLFFPYMESDFVGSMNAYIRTTREPEQMFQTLRRTVAGMDSNLPLYRIRTLNQQLDESLLNERLIATLSAVFGLLATVLAMIGLYGVMAYTVTQRTREIGIRMALGALTGNVVWLVMREVVLLVGIGVAIALPAAWGLSRLVQTQLFGIAPHDPATIALATFTLAVVACAAGYIPALRAARVDPLHALRYE